MGYDDVSMATAGEERDAILRALAEDVLGVGCRAGFVRADRPKDVARALGRDRRRQAPRRAASAA